MLPHATVPAARPSVTAPAVEVPRDAAAGLAEVMAMPAIWRDAGGRLLELPGPGSGIVACGALPGAAAPAPAWTAGELAAAGVPEPAGRVREGTGLGPASAVLTPALPDRALAQRPREADPGYDLPAASSLPAPAVSCGCSPRCAGRSARR
ncbi:MAG: hypothetical protein ACRDOL_40565, partial [Streptosporangiaceae bacterium]